MAVDIIHLLPDSVANQIAAGEVIQRPASVVKELVENSVDAGASSIQIIIKDAGRTLIQVVDNGCGMSYTDARMAFERHATSKITEAQDLFTLNTMGFRGEALPSIAAVSEIEMRTMRSGDATGSRIIISASKVESQKPDICTVGTNMMVKRLFFNLPARRRFLKKDAVELGHIVREFERLALVNSSIEFSLVHNDTIIHKLPPAPLKKRICDLFGKSLDHQIIPVSTDTSLVKIEGLISLPANARRRGALQYFFVNGRNMRHPYFHKAVMNCYEDLIPVDSQPCYFINFTVDPETIDVNIHPQKHEVKFENEQPIWQILTAAIKEALGRFNASSAIDFESVEIPEIPAFNPDKQTTSFPIEIDSHYNPFKDNNSNSRTSYSRPASSVSPQADWEKLYENFTRRSSENLHSSLMNNEDDVDCDNQSSTILKSEKDEGNSKIDSNTFLDIGNILNTPIGFFQLKGKYIITPSKSGLMLIDQHRAHLRVLYEKYLTLAQQGDNMPSQRLIFPENITLDATQHIIATSILSQLSVLGFEIEHIDGKDWVINAVPAILGVSSGAEALSNILTTVGEIDGDEALLSQWKAIALSMARSAAIKYGSPLSDTEIDQLLTDLFRLPTPDYTPDGKPVIRLIEMENINHMFANN